MTAITPIELHAQFLLRLVISLLTRTRQLRHPTLQSFTFLLLARNSEADSSMPQAVINSGSSIPHSLGLELEMSVRQPRHTHIHKNSVDQAPAAPQTDVTFPDGGKEAWIVRNVYGILRQLFLSYTFRDR
jgi:hypothetical protein